MNQQGALTGAASMANELTFVVGITLNFISHAR